MDGSNSLLNMTTRCVSKRTSFLSWLVLVAALASVNRSPVAQHQEPPHGNYNHVHTPVTEHTAIFRTELLRRINRLSEITEDPGQPGVTRPYLSDAGTTARAELEGMMRTSGLSAWTDAVGNVFGDARCITHHNETIREGSRGKKRGLLLMESHLDSVRRGGKWDGVYGVLAGIAVAQAFAHGRDDGGVCELPFDLRVAAFDDEEGASPYGVTNFGARAFAGLLNVSADVQDKRGLAQRFARVFSKREQRDENDLNGGSDDEGRPRREEEWERGVGARVSNAQAREDETYVAALELHIEQGPILEAQGRSVTAVSAIAGQTRLRVQWTGSRGHAGTTPMGTDLRRDALAGAAEGVLLVEQVATSLNPGSDDSRQAVVATVGKLDVVDGGTNVIAGDVSMSVDVRAGQDAARAQAIEQITSGLHRIAARRALSVSIRTEHDVDAIQMSPWLTLVLQRAAAYTSHHPLHALPSPLVSGAGHDMQFVARVVPHVGMLFVRCRHGISHSPNEFVHPDDAHRGVVALYRAVQSIAHAFRTTGAQDEIFFQPGKCDISIK